MKARGITTTKLNPPLRESPTFRRLFDRHRPKVHSQIIIDPRGSERGGKSPRFIRPTAGEIQHRHRPAFLKAQRRQCIAQENVQPGDIPGRGFLLKWNPLNQAFTKVITHSR